MAQTAGLVLFAHGARDPEWAEPFRAIADRVAADRGDLSVKLAFLEFQGPALHEAIAELVAAGRRVIHVAPLFMAQGGHLKNDVPKLLAEIRGRHPGLVIDLLPAIGDVPELRAAIAGWLTGTVPGTPA
ncbi:MAG: CbiX/SirB N-terminal domain-containing protein [Burkholderiales bacterium]|nr:CbiX/SirB N-terminal domain-containing protein [Burkholderiales bacterium]